MPYYQKVEGSKNDTKIFKTSVFEMRKVRENEYHELV